MTTPAGWYDDGSGRLRWWDGQQWTEHFAPEAPGAAEPDHAVGSDHSAAQETPGIDSEDAGDGIASPPDAHVDPAAETTALPDATGSADATQASPQDWSVPSASAGSDDSPTTEYAPPTAAEIPAYAGYPGAAPAYSAPSDGYPNSSGSGAYAPGAPYPGAQPEGPKKTSVLGMVGLGLSVLGTILVFIPVIGFIGFFFLAAGFIVSIISLFLQGKKWPGIAGLALSVVGAILGIIMSFVYLFAFAQGISDEMGDLPTSSPSISAEPSEPEATEGTDGATGQGRPTTEEVAVGLQEIVALSGEGDAFTEEQIVCFADEFVASDIDDETLRVIASGDDATFTDPDAATAFTQEFSDAITVCLVP